MNYTVFITHGMGHWDKLFRSNLTDTLKRYGMNYELQEEITEFNGVLAEGVKSKILRSNLILVLYSKEAYNSKFIFEEIKFSVQLNKRCILVKEKDNPIFGLITGIDVIDFDEKRPQDSISKIVEYAKLEQEKQKTNNALIGLGLAAAGGYLLYKLLKSDDEDDD